MAIKGNIPWNKGKNNYRNLICQGCGSVFDSISRMKTQRFCSRKCAGRTIKNRGQFPIGILPWNKDTKGVMIAWNKGLKGFRAGEKRDPKIYAHMIGNKYAYRGVGQKNERNDSAYQSWSRGVKVRDNWTCQFKNEKCFGHMVAHHILSWKDHPDERYNLNNGITLCEFHHPRRRADEKTLAPVFQRLISVKHQ